MAPKQLEHDQGDVLSTPKRDIFPFMLLPAEIRIQIYNIATSDCICVPYRAHRVYTCPCCWREDGPSPIPPHVKVLLQVKQIREDMLPHLHLAWVGGCSPQGWDSFKHSVIPSVSRLTIGVIKLFDYYGSSHPRHRYTLLSWMKEQSQQTSQRPWNLRHLTLIEDSRNWPGNPLSIGSDSYHGYYPLSSMKETSQAARAMAERFPMIQGLQSLNLVLVQQMHPVLLDILSKRCEARGIDLKVTVQEEHTRCVNKKYLP